MKQKDKAKNNMEDFLLNYSNEILVVRLGRGFLGGICRMIEFEIVSILCLDEE